MYSSGLDIDVEKLYAFYCQYNKSEISFNLYTFRLPMLGRAKAYVEEQSNLKKKTHVRYKTRNADSMPLPSFSPPRHVMSFKQI